jgi:hypothetical protein
VCTADECACESCQHSASGFPLGGPWRARNQFRKGNPYLHPYYPDPYSYPYPGTPNPNPNPTVILILILS